MDVKRFFIHYYSFVKLSITDTMHATNAEISGAVLPRPLD